MDINQIRADFDIFTRKIKGKPVVYFDNGCMSLKPRQVIEAMEKYYQEYSACAGRSEHYLSNEVNDLVEQTRVDVVEFINSPDKSCVVFTKNTTEGINLVVRSFKLEAGDVVLSSDKEHNSNLIPWLYLVKTKGIIHKVVASDENNEFDLNKFEEILKEGNVKLVSIVQTSNLDGVTFPVKEIIKKAHQYGAKVLIDAAQSVPHQKIDVEDLDVDFLVFSGHKICGPTGTGILYGKKKELEELEPFILGGHTVQNSTYDSYTLMPIPDKFEAGLLDYAGIIGLGAAVKYINQVGYDFIEKQELELNKKATAALLKFPQVKIIGPVEPEKRGGIVSFNIQGMDSKQVALILSDLSNVMIRAGQHCVHSWFNAHNLPGSARASFYFYNTLEEVDVFVAGVEKLLKIL